MLGYLLTAVQHRHRHGPEEIQQQADDGMDFDLMTTEKRHEAASRSALRSDTGLRLFPSMAPAL